MRLRLQVPHARGGGVFLQLPSGPSLSSTSIDFIETRGCRATPTRLHSASTLSTTSRHTSFHPSISPARPTALSLPRNALFSSLQAQQTRPSSTFWKLYNAMSGGEPPSTAKEVKKYLQQSHDRIFENNKKWAAEQKAKHPEFFEKLTQGQNPDYLWIGMHFPSSSRSNCASCYS